MGIMHKLLKIFSNFKGLDERTSNITESSENASDAINVNFRKDGGICKRNGYHGLASGKGGKGNSFYYTTDSDTGIVNETLLTVDDNLHKKIKYNFILSYSVTTQYYNAYYCVKANDIDNTKGILFQLIEDEDGTETTYTYNLGTGLETTPTTLANLKTWVEGSGVGAPASGKFTLSTIDVDTSPAAFIEKSPKTQISSTAIYYYVWEQVPTGGKTTAPFNKAWDLRNNEELDNYSFANLNEIMYIGTGFDDLQKYDGNRVYNAGMKKAPAIQINGYEGGGTDPTHLSAQFSFNHDQSHWVDTSTGQPSIEWNFAPDAGEPTGSRWMKTITNPPVFVEDIPEVSISKSGANYIVTVKVKRERKKWRSESLGSAPGYYSHFRGSGWKGLYGTASIRGTYPIGSTVFYGYFEGQPPWWNSGENENTHLWGNSTSAGFVSTLGVQTAPSLNQTIPINWKSTNLDTVSSDYLVKSGFNTTLSYSSAHIAAGGTANQPFWGGTSATGHTSTSFTVYSGDTTYDDLKTWLINVGTIDREASASESFSHSSFNDNGNLNGKVGVPWGQSTGSSTKPILTNINFSGSGITGSSPITELPAVYTGTVRGDIEVGKGATPHSFPLTTFDASSKTGNSLNSIAPGEAPIFAPVGEEYCSIFQDNGEPYPDLSSCEAAGGTWVNTATAGTCSNATHTDFSTCIANGGTWTWTAGMHSAGNQYNEWRWKMTYMQKDAKGNIITGEPGDPFKLTLSTGSTTRYTDTGTLATTTSLIDKSEFSITGVSTRGLKFVNVDLPSIPNSEGFNTACGIVDIPGSDPTNGVITSDSTNIDYFNSNVNGDYSAVIPLKAGHTFQVGDTAYFKDLHRSSVEINSTTSSTDYTVNSTSGSQIYREFLITATTSTSITVTVTGNSADNTPILNDRGEPPIESHYFTVAAGQFISNNLRVQIWRTKNLGYQFEGDPTYYLVEEIPACNLVGAELGDKINYKDQFKDADLGPAYEDLITLPALTRHYPLPKSKYLAAVTNTLILAGNPASVGTIYRTEPGNPEIYSGLGSFFTVAADGGGAISGLGVLNKLLYVFQEKAVSAVGGNISTSQIRIDVVSNPSMGIGCTSHHTIKEVNGVLYFLSEKGIYGIAPGSSPKEISALVAPLFDKSKYNLNRSVAANWNSNDLYFLVLPPIEATGNSLTVVYNTYRDAWTKWDNLDITKGVAIGAKDIYFTGGIYSTLYKFQQNGNTEDYADHDTAIAFKYVTNWEALGDATVPKRFLRLKALSIDSSETFETDGFILKTSTEKDYDITPLAELDFDFNQWAVDGWGESGYDATGWGDNIVRNKYLKSKLSSPKTKSLRISFKNEEINKNALISGYELEIVAPYRPEIKE